MPCSKLAGKNGQRLLAKRVSRTGYTRFYTRVSGKGMIKMGDAFERVERNPDRISVDDVNDVIYERSQNFTLIERLTGMPQFVASGRAVFAERLERAGGRRQWV